MLGVPAEYLDFREVFSKAKATSLPPHRPYDCAINLQPGATPPRGRLYSLSVPERGVMETYINDGLAAGIIRPSSSPAGAGFFFVEKKDKTLRPCIDYRGLNDITIKNRYPLPLISSAFELLEGATIFTKLDLRNAYHLVRIQPSARPAWPPVRGSTMGPQHSTYLSSRDPTDQGRRAAPVLVDVTGWGHSGRTFLWTSSPVYHHPAATLLSWRW